MLSSVSPSRPRSPLALKRQRLANGAATTTVFVDDTSSSLRHLLPGMPSVASHLANHAAPAHASGSAHRPPDAVSPGMQGALDALDLEAHNVRLRVATQEQDDKQTKSSYERHVQSYQRWWEADQSSRSAGDPTRVVIPAFPITAPKVVMFLDYETTREKFKKGSKKEVVPGSSVGKSQVAQVISALENHRRLNQHLSKHVPDSQTPLRHDIRIRAFESAAKHNEPKRIDSAQSLKAAGSSSDTYTSEELERCSLWCLSDPSGPQGTCVGLRDRGMLLLSAATAFRGGSCRALEWSDLFVAQMPLDGPELDVAIPVLAALADNAKHNQVGRVEEHGAIRHRFVEVCAVGATAAHFFGRFHISGREVPNFAPDFTRKDYGEYGYHEWYSRHVFSTADELKEMSYESHRDRFNLIHKKNSVSTTSVTHVGRHYAAKTARSHGASVNGTKALGGWSENGSFTPVYDNALPSDALLGAARFNARRPELHHLPRDNLVPPPELVAEIFPFVEHELAALEDHERCNPLARDIALRQFLKMLAWFRVVLLQDCAVIFTSHPEFALFKHRPFNTARFREFAMSSTSILAHAEEQARLAFKNLPENLVESLRGVMSTVTLDQQLQRKESNARWEQTQAQLQRLEGLVELSLSSKKSRRAKTKLAPPLPVQADVPCSSGQHLCGAPFIPSTPANITINIMNPGSVVSPALTSTLSAISNAVSPSHLAGTRPAPALPRSSTHESEDQTEKWAALATKYGDERLRKHEWEWREKESTWVPYYRPQQLSQVLDIWTEHASGLNGYLSERELTEGWGAKWKRDSSNIKSEWGRRQRVVRLINELVKKQRWTVDLALRFLVHEFPKHTPRQVCDSLAGSNWNRVLARAQGFP